MSNGTRHGCPFCPLLFILCLEHLAEAIRSHPDIRGVLMHHREYKLSLFADDVLLTLTNLHISLPSLHALPLHLLPVDLSLKPLPLVHLLPQVPRGTTHTLISFPIIRQLYASVQGYQGNADSLESPPNILDR